MKVLIYCYKDLDYGLRNIYSYGFYNVSNFKEADDIVLMDLTHIYDQQELQKRIDYERIYWSVNCIKNQYNDISNAELYVLYTKLGNEKFIKEYCIA